MQWGKTIYVALAATVLLATQQSLTAASSSKDKSAAPLSVTCLDEHEHSKFSNRKPDPVLAAARIRACTKELASESDPQKRILILVSRAGAYLGIKAPARALLDIETVAKLDPDPATLSLGRGMILSSLGFLALGRYDADQAIQLGYSGSEAYGVRGVVEAYSGDYREAIADLDFELAQSPDDFTALVARGYAAAEMGVFDEAISYYNRADAACDCKKAQLYLYRGDAHFALDQYSAALSDFEKSNSIEPSPGTDDYIRDVENAMSAPAGALQPPNVPNAPSLPIGRTHTCDAFYPPLSSMLREHGDVLIHYDVSASGSISAVGIDKPSGIDRLDQAASTCVVHHWRNTPAIQNGVAAASPGHRAILHFVAPELPPTNDVRARTLAALARYDEAIAEYDRIIGADPKDADIIFRRGMTYYVMQNYPAATRDFDEAVRLKPSMDEAIAGQELANTMHAAKP